MHSHEIDLLNARENLCRLQEDVEQLNRETLRSLEAALKNLLLGESKHAVDQIETVIRNIRNFK